MSTLKGPFRKPTLTLAHMTPKPWTCLCWVNPHPVIGTRKDLWCRHIEALLTPSSRAITVGGTDLTSMRAKVKTPSIPQNSPYNTPLYNPPLRSLYPKPLHPKPYIARPSRGLVYSTWWSLLSRPVCLHSDGWTPEPSTLLFIPLRPEPYKPSRFIVPLK